MKLYNRTLFFASLFIIFPFLLQSQESEKANKTVHIKTIEQTGNKVIVKDTTFTLPADGDVNEIVQEYSKAGTSDSSTIQVVVDVDEEKADEPCKKVIIIGEDGKHVVTLSGKSGSGDISVFKNDVNMNREPHLITHSKVIKITPNGEEEMKVVKPHGHHKTLSWDKDNEECGDFEFEFDTDALEEQLELFRDRLENIEDYIEEKYEMMHSDSILRQKLENLKNIDFDLDLPSVEFSPGAFRWVEEKPSDEVTDMELRDAGIKNKPDRLDLSLLEVDNDNGIVKLSFKMKEEGTPKVTLYNIYGDKVFSGIPEMKDGKYNLTFDLSKKQPGTYYLMIVLKNSSKTIRIQNS
ncbi:MAG: hypothetical protein GXO86_03920 [Chlorobi bacterium]|nr:hypothetical protein [Chlorobiota bacterium]